MSFTQFLINLSVTFLTVALPVAISIYLAIRLAIAHGEISFRRNRTNIKEAPAQYDRKDVING